MPNDTDILTYPAHEPPRDLPQGLEFGDFAHGTSRAVNGKIVVATYNIRYAVGSFLITGSLLRRFGLKLPRRRPALVARHIKAAARAFSAGKLLPQPDILALQEADCGTVRAGGLHVARELARQLNYHYVHASAENPRRQAAQRKQWYLDFEEHIALNEPGDTGMAMLSVLPLLDAARVELPWSVCAWRPKLALYARYAVDNNRQLSIYNAHIDPHAHGRQQLAQHETILALADALPAGEPVILLGDFNTLKSAARTAMRQLLEARGYTTPMPTGVATWRAGAYQLHADWIFLRGARAVRWGVARPLGVSDHWPVWMEIEV